MAEPSTPDPQTAPDLRGQAAQQLAGWLDVADLAKVEKWVSNVGHQIAVDVISFVLKYGAKLGAEFGTILADAENDAGAEFSRLASVAVQDLFGVSADVQPGRGGRGARTAAANAVGDMLLRAFAGAAAGAGSAGGELQPSDVPAKNFLSTMTQLSLEGWLEGWIMEALSLGQLETFGELDDKISHTLGLGRASAAVHGPLVRHLIVTPLEWKLLREHRPTQLTASQAAKQIARGFGDKEKWLEELRRQGYSEDRIAAVLNEQRHFFGAADVRTFVEREYWDKDRGLQHLRDQGYDEQAATDALRLEGLRRINQLEDQEASAIIAAYVAGDIDHGTVSSALGAAVTNLTERNLLSELADVRRAMNVKRLTLAQVESMVKSGVLSIVDYRHAAERDGYEPGDVAALELQLRWEMDRTKAIAEHRAELEAQRAAEKQARAAAAAAKKAELEQRRALERRGKRADLERAAVRGLISLDRVAEIYATQFDDETAGILLDLLAAERQDYVTQQQRRDDAAKQAGVRKLDLGSLEQAVARGILTIGQYRDRLAEVGFSPADVDVLAATLQAKIDDTTAAKAAREEAAKAAKVKHVSLTTIETLVRRGHRTMADYDRTLQDLGFDDGARAAMEDLLQDQIDEDAKARAERDAAAAKRDVHGVSLEQMRRGVLLGVVTIDAFQTWLVDNNYTADAQIVLVDELRADVAEADAARQRRAEADAAKDSRDAPIADVARAARLGLITVDTYAGRLARASYSDDAIDLEVDLLLQEMADVAEARRARQAADDAARSRGLSLAQTERAVRGGVLPIAAYTAAAQAAGLTSAAADVLTRLLQQELDAAAAAEARRAAIAAAAAERALSLPQLEAGVKAGLISVDDFAARIRDLGYGDDDAALLVAMLGQELELLDVARTRRQAIATGQPEAHVTLSQLERAVKEGLITMEAYLDELRRRGYGQGLGVEFDEGGRLVLSPTYEGEYDDTALLGLLLQVDLDNAANKSAG